VENVFGEMAAIKMGIGFTVVYVIHRGNLLLNLFRPLSAGKSIQVGTKLHLELGMLSGTMTRPPPALAFAKQQPRGTKLTGAVSYATVYPTYHVSLPGYYAQFDELPLFVKQAFAVYFFFSKVLLSNAKEPLSNFCGDHIPVKFRV